MWELYWLLLEAKVGGISFSFASQLEGESWISRNIIFDYKDQNDSSNLEINFNNSLRLYVEHGICLGYKVKGQNSIIWIT